MDLKRFVQEVYGVSHGCSGVEMEVDVGICKGEKVEVIDVHSATIRLFRDIGDAPIEIGFGEN
jgi:hypothetical protein